MLRTCLLLGAERGEQWREEEPHQEAKEEDEGCKLQPLFPGEGGKPPHGAGEWKRLEVVWDLLLKVPLDGVHCCAGQVEDMIQL